MKVKKNRRRKVPVTSASTSTSKSVLVHEYGARNGDADVDSGIGGSGKDGRSSEEEKEDRKGKGKGKGVRIGMGGSVNPATSARIIRRFHVLLKRRAQLERERDVRIRKSERRARREDQEYGREGEGGLVSSSGHVPGYGSGSGSSLGRTGGLGGVEEIEQKLGEVEEEMERIGGLEVYQRMSSIGQGKDRGGGSEKVLIGWLRELGYGSPTEGTREGSNSNLNGKGMEKGMRKIKLLEVGALKPDNYASCSLWVEVLPIDLRSQYPGIIEQDFLLMDQEANEGKWDAISLSLVVNFVPEPKNRGKMLRYSYSMLRENGLLFLALPLPCVSNSRYLTFEHLKSLMDHIGFDTLRERWKDGGKMVYWLFQKQRNDNTKEMCDIRFDKKITLREGQRNNFCILL